MTADELVVGRWYRVTTQAGEAEWYGYLGQEGTATCWLSADGWRFHIASEHLALVTIDVTPLPVERQEVDCRLEVRRRREFWLTWAIERALGTASAALREGMHGR